jgi:hypothetical protein
LLTATRSPERPVETAHEFPARVDLGADEDVHARIHEAWARVEEADDPGSDPADGHGPRPVD